MLRALARSTSLWLLATCLPALLSAAALAFPQESGDLVAKVVEIRNASPGSGSEGFVKPSTNDLARWGDVVTAIVGGDMDAVDALLQTNFPSYGITEFTDTGHVQRLYYIVSETPTVSNGWGTIIVNPTYRRMLCIQCPHIRYDLDTHTEGADIFRRTGARFLLMSGTHRCANAEISPCDGTTSACGDGQYHVSDMAHFVDATFQETHERFTALVPDLYSVSVHGHANGSCEDIFMSNGRLSGSTAMIYAMKTNILDQGGITVAVAGDGSVCPLTGGSNVQGRHTNGSLDPCDTAATNTTGFFIHIEQTRLVRSNATHYVKLINALNDQIPLAPFALTDVGEGTNDILELSFDSLSGTVYQVERSPSLGQAENFQPQAVVTGAADQATWAGGTVTNDSGFFRVRALAP